MKRHQSESKRLQDHINAMYVDKLDGVVDSAFYDKMSNQWRDELNRCQQEIDRLQIVDKSYMDEGVQILELASNAQRLFEKQEPHQKRLLLNFLLSNCSWEDGEVTAIVLQPLDSIAETTAIAISQKATVTAISAKVDIWLPDEGSNLGPAD